MKKVVSPLSHCFLLGFAWLVFSVASVHAGTVCLAETDSGKIVKLEITSVGTYGSFQHADLTVTDKDGKQLFSKTFKQSGQYAETIHQGKAVVIFTALSGEADVVLTFIGKDEDEYDDAKLLSTLRDPKRQKPKGNRMTVSIYKEGNVAELRFEDIVVSLEKDV